VVSTTATEAIVVAGTAMDDDDTVFTEEVIDGIYIITYSGWADEDPDDWVDDVYR